MTVSIVVMNGVMLQLLSAANACYRIDAGKQDWASGPWQAVGMVANKGPSRVASKHDAGSEAFLVLQ